MRKGRGDNLARPQSLDQARTALHLDSAVRRIDSEEALDASIIGRLARPAERVILDRADEELAEAKAVASARQTIGAAVDAGLSHELAVESAQEKIRAALAGLTPPAQRRVIAAMKERFTRSTPHGFFGGEVADGKRGYIFPNDWYADTFDKLAAPEREHDEAAFAEYLKVLDAPVLQSCESSAFHRLMEAAQGGRLLVAFSRRQVGDNLLDLSADSRQIFVVRHDWARAFEKSDQFDAGDVSLPYLVCAFEFRISGMRFIAHTADDPDDTEPAVMLIFCETSRGWSSLGGGRYEHGHWCLQDSKRRELLQPIWNLIVAQIRAIAIALEAQVATTEIVRAPHKLNAKRERAGKPPIYDYHIVDLARRQRTAPRLIDPNETREIHHKRLHWVRGHWRHFDNHKSWIKWHLRGSPDLGFVDKEYRL